MSHKRRFLRGFTLIEILVVLVIVGMMTGIALPRLTSIYRSVEYANQRASIRAAIDGLGYLAFASGKAVVLTSTADDKRENQPVQIPAGWRIEVAKPVRYSARGVCGGGKVVVTDPDGGSEAFELVPPLCLLTETAS